MKDIGGKVNTKMYFDHLGDIIGEQSGLYQKNTIQSRTKQKALSTYITRSKLFSGKIQSVFIYVSINVYDVINLAPLFQ